MPNIDVSSIGACLPCTTQPDDQIFAADIDGDGANEVVVYSPSLQQISIVHSFTYGQLTFTYPNSPGPTVLWPSGSDQNWMTSWSSAQGQIAGGTWTMCPAWAISPADTACCLDINGDGQAELVVFNALTGAVGVLRWQYGALQTIWYSLTMTGGWTYSRGDQLYPGKLTCPLSSFGPQTDIFIVNAASLKVGILHWSGSQSQLSCIWTSQNSVGQFEIYSNSNYIIGDVNQDGRDEVVIQNLYSLYVGVFEWEDSNSQLSFVSQVYRQVPGFGGVSPWALSAADQMQFVYQGAHIFVFNPTDGYLGVLEWRLSGLTCIWSVNNQIAGSTSPWQVDGQTQYLVVPGAAVGTTTNIVAYKRATNSLGIPLWNPIEVNLQTLADPASQYSSGWNVSSGARFVIDNSGSASLPKVFVCDGNFGAIDLQPINQELSVAGESSFPVPVWSPTLLASAPSTPFPTYSADQAAIYAYLSQQVDLAIRISDVRSQYTNSAYTALFPTWAQSVKGAQMPTGNGWTLADWNAVQTGLVAELNNVASAWGWYGGVYNTFWPDVIAQQKADLSTVTATIEQNQSIQTATYWNQQAFVAVIWGLAAVPALSTLAVPLAMSASLMGSGFGAPGSDPQIPIGQLDDRIDNASSASLFQYQTELATIVKDPVKLAILSALVEKQWAISVDSFSSQKNAISAANRIGFYQAIFPGVFRVVWYPNTSSSYAANLDSFGVCPPAESYCYYAVPNVANPGNFDVYVLDAPGNLGATTLPSQALMTDLFTNLNISKDVFFMAYPGWSEIPRWTEQFP